VSQQSANLSIWTKQEQEIYQTIEENFTTQFQLSYEEKVKSLLSELLKLDISKPNITEYIIKQIEDELGVKFTNSQKRAFTDTLNEAWKQGQDYKNPETDSNPEPLSFNKIALDFFQKTLKIDVGGQFKGTKNNFTEAVKEALKTGDINSAIKSLEEKLLGKLDKEGKRINSEIVTKLDWIVRDNVNRSRTFSRSLRMEQVGITRVQILAIMDQRTSHICKSLNGKTVELKTVNAYINEFISDDPERAGFWNDRKNPTVEQAKALDLDNLTGDEVLAHLGHKAPPYHPRCRTTLVVSTRETVAAKTIEDAKEIAKKEFGVDANFGGKENLSLANHINKGLYEARDRGIKMPEEIIFNQDIVRKYYGNQESEVPAIFLEPKYSPNNKTTIAINDKNEYWKDPKKNAFLDHQKDKYDIRRSSTDNEYHIIIHELSHFNHYSKNEKSYRDNKTFNSEEKEKIINKVSELATLNSRELVAEVNTGISFGKKYDEKIMKLYEESGGF